MSCGKRIIAFLTLICFLVNAWSGPGYAKAPSALPNALIGDHRDDLTSPSRIQVPPEFGKIQESFEGRSSQTVVLIQDAHAVPDAQRNIWKLIEHFEKKYGIKQVAVEGAASELDTQIFRSFPDKGRLKKVFEEYLEKGELTGAGAAALFSSEGGSGTTFQGIEDWNLYEEGLGHFLKALEKEPELLARLKVEGSDLLAQKKKSYSKQLLEIDQSLEAFQENQGDLAEVLKKLIAVKKPAAGSELALVAASFDAGASGEEALEAEVKHLAEKVGAALRGRPERDDLNAFNEKRQAFQTGQISAGEFGLYLIGLGGGLRMTEGLHRLIQNHKRLRDLEGTKFFDELRAYADSIKESLFRGEEDRELDRQSRGLYLLKKLTKLELSREEWEEIKKSQVTRHKSQDTSDKQQVTSNKKQTARHKSQDTSDEKQAERNNLQETRLWAYQESFYKNAEKRDGVFFEKLTKLKENAVLTAGGFHAQGLMQRLKEAGISYVLIRPEIKDIPDNSVYRQQMHGDVSWKSYFRVENGKVNLSDAFVRAARDRLLGINKSQDTSHKTQEVRNTNNLVPGVPASLKAWRDQILLDLVQKEQITRAGSYTRFLDELALRDPLSSFRPQWMKRLDKLIEGLRHLEANHQLTEQNVLKLFSAGGGSALGGKPSAMTAAAVAGELASGSNLRIDLLPALPALRSELRAIFTAMTEPEQKVMKEKFLKTFVLRVDQDTTVGDLLAALKEIYLRDYIQELENKKGEKLLSSGPRSSTSVRRQPLKTGEQLIVTLSPKMDLGVSFEITADPQPDASGLLALPIQILQEISVAKILRALDSYLKHPKGYPAIQYASVEQLRDETGNSIPLYGKKDGGRLLNEKSRVTVILKPNPKPRSEARKEETKERWAETLKKIVVQLPEGTEPTVRNVASASKGSLSEGWIREIFRRYSITYETVGMVRERSLEESRKKWVSFLKELVSRALSQKQVPTVNNLAKISEGDNKVSLSQIFEAIAAYKIPYTEVGIVKKKNAPGYSIGPLDLPWKDSLEMVKNERNPSKLIRYTKSFLSALVAKPPDVPWQEYAKDLLPDPQDLPLGETDRIGQITLAPGGPDIEYHWSPIGMKKDGMGWSGTILEGGVKDAAFELTIEWKKSGHGSIKKNYQISSFSPRTLQGRRAAKGKTFDILEIDDQAAFRALGSLMAQSRESMTATSEKLQNLKGLRTGVSGDKGLLNFAPVASYGTYKWIVPGISEPGWSGVILDSGLQDGFFTFTMQWEKEGQKSFQEKYQLGPTTSALHGQREEKGKTIRALQINRRSDPKLVVLALAERINRLDAGISEENLKQLRPLKGVQIGTTNSLGQIHFRPVPGYVYFWSPIGRTEEGWEGTVVEDQVKGGFEQFTVEWKKEGEQAFRGTYRVGPETRDIKGEGKYGGQTVKVLKMTKTSTPADLLGEVPLLRITINHQEFEVPANGLVEGQPLTFEHLFELLTREKLIDEIKNKEVVIHREIQTKNGFQTVTRVLDLSGKGKESNRIKGFYLVSDGDEIEMRELEVKSSQTGETPARSEARSILNPVAIVQRGKTIRLRLFNPKAEPVLPKEIADKGNGQKRGEGDATKISRQESERLRAGILEILDQQKAPIQLARVHELVLEKMPEFQKIKDKSVGDIIGREPLLKGHPNYKTWTIDSEAIQKRRDAFFGLIQGNQGDAKTPNQYTSLLNQIPGQESVKVGTVFDDFRLDPRFSEEPYRSRVVLQENQVQVKARRDKLFEIFEQQILPMTRKRLAGLLRLEYPEEYGSVEDKTITDDTLLDDRFKNSPKLIVGRGSDRAHRILSALMSLPEELRSKIQEDDLSDLIGIGVGTTQEGGRIEWELAPGYRYSWEALSEKGWEGVIQTARVENGIVQVDIQWKKFGMSNYQVLRTYHIGPANDPPPPVLEMKMDPKHPKDFSDLLRIPTNPRVRTSLKMNLKVDMALHNLIYGLTQADPGHSVSLPPYQWNIDRTKEREELVEALEMRKREKGGESANYPALLIREAPSLYARVVRWNKQFPEYRIFLPYNPAPHVSPIYQTKEDAEEAKKERKSLGLENTPTALKENLDDGGDMLLLRFVYRWNKENPANPIALDKHIRTDTYREARLEPFELWYLQTQKIEGAADEQRMEWWRALQEEGDHEAGKKLAESFIPSVDGIAKQFGRKDKHFNADLIQNGNLIVLETIYPEQEKDKWDPASGISITEFVETRLKEKMRRLTLDGDRSIGRYSIDTPYPDSEKKKEPPTFDLPSREEQINSFVNERDESSGLPMILFEEKHRIARELRDWFKKEGLIDWADRRGIRSLSISIIGSLGALGAAIRGFTDLNLMVVTDAAESQVEDLKEKIKEMTGGRDERAELSELTTISVGKELIDYEEAVQSQNGFVGLLRKHGVGQDFRHGIASIEFVRLTPTKQTAKSYGWNLDPDYSDADPFHRQQTRAGFHLGFFDERVLEQSINGILVLENATGATTRLSKTLPDQTADVYGYYQRFLERQAANIREAQKHLLEKEESSPAPPTEIKEEKVKKTELKETEVKEKKKPAKPTQKRSIDDRIKLLRTALDEDRLEETKREYDILQPKFKKKGDQVKPEHRIIMARAEKELGLASPRSEARSSTPLKGSSLKTGEIFKGRYKIIKDVGKTEMSEIYEAYDQTKKRVVILKFRPGKQFFRELSAENEKGKKLFEDNRDDPVSPEYLDLGSDEKSAWLTLAKEEGQNALDWSKNNKNPIEIQDLFGKILQRVVKVHQQKTLHLDLKASNIWVRPDGQILLLDWEGALAESLPELSSYAFTPIYSVPENFPERQKPTPQTDIFSLGMLLYFFATDGQHTFALPKVSGKVWIKEFFEKKKRMPNAQEIAAQKEFRTPFKPFAPLIAKAIHTDPAQRYASAAEMRLDFFKIFGRIADQNGGIVLSPEKKGLLETQREEISLQYQLNEKALAGLEQAEAELRTNIFIAEMPGGRELLRLSAKNVVAVNNKKAAFEKNYFQSNLFATPLLAAWILQAGSRLTKYDQVLEQATPERRSRITDLFSYFKNYIEAHHYDPAWINRINLSQSSSARSEARKVAEAMVEIVREGERASEEKIKSVIPEIIRLGMIRIEPELEAAAADAWAMEQISAVVAGKNYYEDLREIKETTVIEYQISAGDLIKMETPRSEMRALLKTARDAVALNDNIIVRIQVPPGMAKKRELEKVFNALDHFEHDPVLHELSNDGHELVLSHQKLKDPGAVQGPAAVTITNTSNHAAKGKKLLSDRYQEETADSIQYSGPEGFETASRLFTAGLILASQLKQQTVEGLIQYEENHFRARNQDALTQIASFLAGMLDSARLEKLASASA